MTFEILVIGERGRGGGGRLMSLVRILFPSSARKSSGFARISNVVVIVFCPKMANEQFYRLGAAASPPPPPLSTLSYTYEF